MLKKFFKCGDYGAKGNWTPEKVEAAFSENTVIPLIYGHVGDYKTLGIPRTAIPSGGTVEYKGITDEGFVLGEFTYNVVTEEAVINRLYTDFSAGFTADGKADHVALLGYAPPHIKDLDKAFSQDSAELTYTYIEYSEGGKQMTLAEILAALNGMSLADKLEVIKALKGSFSDAEKDAARTIAWEFAEFTGAKPVITVAETEAEKKLKADLAESRKQIAEFAATEKKTKVDSFVAELMSSAKIPKAVEAKVKEFAESIFDNPVIEFSDDRKVSPMELFKGIFNEMPAIIQAGEFAAEPGSEFTEEDPYTAAAKAYAEKNK